MSRADLLCEYVKGIIDIKNRAKDLNLSDGEVHKIFESCFIELKNHESLNLKHKAQKYFLTVSKTFIFLLIFALASYILLNFHQPTSSIVLRNVQGLIYPGLKVLRFLAVPIIQKFPSLTDLYDETCLVENPYFYVSDMECWPCENVHTIVDITGFNNHSLYKSGIPYVIKTDQKHTTLEDVVEMYKKDKEVFDKDGNSIKSTNTDIHNVHSLLTSDSNYLKSSDSHITWRINRMAPGRKLRTLFPKPYIISEWSGQSTEKFLLIDSSEASAYSLPNPECSYVFLVQGSGERTIILKPSAECLNSCRTLSVNLKPSYMLWYNWWYWRPISLPMENSTEPSISYLSSYC